MPNLRADPPDFIDSNSYGATDVTGMASGAGSTALGTVIVGAGVLGGIMLLNRGREVVEDTTGVDTGSGDGPDITVN